MDSVILIQAQTMIFCQYSQGWLYRGYRYLLSQRRGERRENFVVCSPDTASRYPGHVMKFVRVSFHSGDVSAPPHTSPLLEGEGGWISSSFFLVPRYSSLVPVIILCASA